MKDRPSEANNPTRGPAETTPSRHAFWRRLSPKDLPEVIRVAEEIHPDLPESSEVFAERIKLFPIGCLALISSRSNTNEGGEEQLCGYAISHPSLRQHPPALNTLIGAIAPDADQYYIHDLAISPSHRGGGSAREAVEMLIDVGNEYATIGLVSVYGTEGFLERFGFVDCEEEGMREKVRECYGDDAVWLERVQGALSKRDSVG